MDRIETISKSIKDKFVGKVNNEETREKIRQELTEHFKQVEHDLKEFHGWNDEETERNLYATYIGDLEKARSKSIELIIEMKG